MVCYQPCGVAIIPVVSGRNLLLRAAFVIRGGGTVSPDEENQIVHPAFNALFLCRRNFAGSLMAEAILRDIGHGRFNVYSAGFVPAAAPLPEVLEKLRAFGHDTTTLHSKSWHLFTGPAAPNLAQCDGEGLPMCFGCARWMACGPRFRRTEKEDCHGPD